MSILFRIFKKAKIIKHILDVRAHKNVDLPFNTLIDDSTFFHGMNCIHDKCDLRGADIGYMTYMGDNCRFTKTRIGNFCAIASNVKIICGEHPTSRFLSVHDIFYSKDGYKGMSFVNEDLFDEYKYADKDNCFCVIGNDVWIGEDVRIMEGITIHDGAIIAAGALVTKNVPPYAIVGGVPAKILKYRFDKEDVEYLLQDSWWNKDINWIAENAKFFTSVEDYKNVNNDVGLLRKE